MAKNTAEVLEVEDSLIQDEADELVSLVEDDQDETEEDETLSTKDVAKEVGTTPKTLRRFLRAQVRAAGGQVGVHTPGQGGRYAFGPEEIEGIKAQFAEWMTQKEAAKAAREAAAEEIASSHDSETEVDDADELEELEV